MLFTVGGREARAESCLSRWDGRLGLGSFGPTVAYAGQEGSMSLAIL